MRSLSQNAVVALNSLQTDVAFFFLVEIRHVELAGGVLRYVNNTVDVTSGGAVYTAYPFKLTLAVDDGATLPGVSIEFDNVGLEIINVVRGLTSAPSVNLYLVLSNAPDVREMAMEDLTLVDIEYDVKNIRGTLVAGDLLNAPYPADAYQPAQFPALFY